MSCNGCRVLRKGCGETCILRPCLQWIASAEAQGHATLFVAKFFGRAGLMGFMCGVSEKERPSLFQSLLYEACGRTVNPVHGTVGLLWSGNWNICEEAVKTVLKGGTLRPLPHSIRPSPMPFASSPTPNVLKPYVAPPQTLALTSATTKSKKTWGDDICGVEATRRTSEMGGPRKKDAALGQIVMPVPVRGRPSMESILESANNSSLICSDHVELDLTLNPYPTTTGRAGRVASPNSALSVNSEGSSTTQLPTLQWLSPPHQEHRLLQLLV